MNSHGLRQDLEAVASIEAVPMILEVVTRSTGMRFAAVARVTDRQWICCAVRDEISFGLAVGGELKLETTICDEIRQSGEAVVIDDVAASQHYCGHHTPAMYGFRSYISMPVYRRGGEFFGTLCAIDPEPAKLHRPEVIGMFKLFAQMLGAQLDAEDAARRQRDDNAHLAAQMAALTIANLENAKLNAQLQEQDKRKDEFLAVLAHELRNPLAPIRTGLSLLQRGPTAEAAARTLDTMERQLGQMIRLIDDLMDASRLSSGKVQLRTERLDLRRAVELALESCRPSIDAAGHRVEMQLGPEPLWVLGDIARLAQAIGNLINNASKYTAAGGRITLSTFVAGGCATVAVQDDGAGIDPDMLPRVFDMFAQEDRSRSRSQGGLGIGLALVRQLVDLHGGRVSAASPGQNGGSTFTIELPLAHPHLADRVDEAAPSGAGDVPANALRVLVVDDNVDATETLAEILNMHGHCARAAHSGEEALALVAEFVPDCVLLDIGLPGITGYEVAEQLRASKDPQLAACKLVALTGWGGEDDRRRASRAGFDSHLTKPVETHQLLNVLRRISHAEAKA